MLQVGKQRRQPTPGPGLRAVPRTPLVPIIKEVVAVVAVPIVDNHLVRGLEVAGGNRDLFEITITLGASGCFPRGLNRRQEQRDQDSDDRDDN